jgi:hypothetical protein
MVKEVEVQGEQIIGGGNGGLVASKSRPGAWHCIRVVDGVTTCDCRARQAD